MILDTRTTTTSQLNLAPLRVGNFSHIFAGVKASMPLLPSGR